ncbi:DUF3592 domain-containing protein [Hymenobacter sp. RP-2-7]|uniref:DUF3592 domain-containing protein n=1 Tax=Hymenobacter polaris TaxID=2682546 RepID=A0A7Y0FKY7_9BACT|nr:DUF3592 domain-containing protein [Hymenobacter polaris]NML63990.1 DUF3592 domain-containing protein [Hymenobacter polaris]
MATVRVQGSPTAFRLGGAVFSLVGALLLVLAWHLTQQQRQFRAGASTAQGVVEGLGRDTHPGNGGRSTTAFILLVRFSDAKGNSYQIVGTAGASRPASYQVGQRVTVYYDPARPWDGQLGGFLGQGMKLTFAWGFGLVMTGVGLLCLRLSSPANRPA